MIKPCTCTTKISKSQGPLIKHFHCTWVPFHSTPTPNKINYKSDNKKTLNISLGIPPISELIFPKPTSTQWNNLRRHPCCLVQFSFWSAPFTKKKKHKYSNIPCKWISFLIVDRYDAVFCVQDHINFYCTTPSKLVVYAPMGAQHAESHTVAQ